MPDGSSVAGSYVREMPPGVRSLDHSLKLSRPVIVGREYIAPCLRSRVAFEVGSGMGSIRGW